MIKYKNFKFYLLNTWPSLEELEKKTKDEIVEFMKKMYQGGIFDEIEQLIRRDEFKNPKDDSYCYRIGHIVLMAICSAIDTLGAFLKGSKKTDSDVSERFRAFIQSYFPKEYSVERKKIYKHLRCDSIHGWTLNKAYITGIENDQDHLSRRNGILHISLLEFFDDLKEAFLNYCEKIMSDDKLKRNILRRYKELKEK